MVKKSFYLKYGKNFFDKVVSIAFIMCTSWLYIICTVLIVLDTGLPIIYKQKRVGQYGVPFFIYKFRTMIKNADQIGPTSTAIGDARVTHTGEFLRKTSLDELPQFFNVLKGDMSIVGYRPDVARENDDYFTEKYKLKPGLTGFAQIHGRSSLTPEEKLYWENLYSSKVSFFTDIFIMIRTVLVVFKKRGAY